VFTTIGVWLLVVSVVAIAVEGVVAAVWAASLAKRSVALSERLESERTLIEADLERLRAAVEEAKRLWLPYRRILRWVRHPLAIALLESYARRRAGAR
jgi:uncharacterized protein YqgV (UPF0045/DUF77 family)